MFLTVTMECSEFPQRLIKFRLRETVFLIDLPGILVFLDQFC